MATVFLGFAHVMKEEESTLRVVMNLKLKRKGLEDVKGQEGIDRRLN